MTNISDVYSVLQDSYELATSLEESLPSEDMLLASLPADAVADENVRDYVDACIGEYEYILEVLEDIEKEIEEHKNFLKRELNGS